MSDTLSSNIFGFLNAARGLAGEVKNTVDLDAQSLIAQYKPQLDKSMSNAYLGLQDPGPDGTTALTPQQAVAAWSSGQIVTDPNAPAKPLYPDGQDPASIIQGIQNPVAQKQLQQYVTDQQNAYGQKLQGDVANWDRANATIRFTNGVTTDLNNPDLTPQQKIASVATGLQNLTPLVAPDHLQQFRDNWTGVIAHDTLYDAGNSILSAAGPANALNALPDAIKAVNATKDLTMPDGSPIPITDALRQQITARLTSEADTAHSVYVAQQNEATASAVGSWETQNYNQHFQSIGSLQADEAVLMSPDAKTNALAAYPQANTAMLEKTQQQIAYLQEQANRAGSSEGISTAKAEAAMWATIGPMVAAGEPQSTIQAALTKYTVGPAAKAAIDAGDQIQSIYQRHLDNSPNYKSAVSQLSQLPKQAQPTALAAFNKAIADGKPDGSSYGELEIPELVQKVLKPTLATSVSDFLSTAQSGAIATLGGPQGEAQFAQDMGLGKKSDILQREGIMTEKLQSALGADLPPGVTLAPNPNNKSGVPSFLEMQGGKPTGATWTTFLDSKNNIIFANTKTGKAISVPSSNLGTFGPSEADTRNANAQSAVAALPPGSPIVPAIRRSVKPADVQKTFWNTPGVSALQKLQEAITNGFNAPDGSSLKQFFGDPRNQPDPADDPAGYQAFMQVYSTLK